MNRQKASHLSCVALAALTLILAASGLITGLETSLVSPYANSISAMQLFPYVFVGLLLGGGMSANWLAGFGLQGGDGAWAPTAIASLLCGMTVAIGTVFILIAESISRVLHTYFVFSDPLIRVVHLMLLTFACFVPACATGRLLFELTIRSNPMKRERSFIIFAFTVGTVLGAMILFVGAPPSLAMQFASLPAFGIALLSVKMMSHAALPAENPA